MAKANKTVAASVDSASDSHMIPLSDIYVDYKWNARVDVGQSSGGPEDSTGIDGLMQSIATKGQDTPVIVRTRRPDEKFRQPFFLVAGFRRVTAIAKLAQTNKDPKPLVKAFIRENLSEAEARELNLRENTARENLSGPDLAFGIARMWEAAKAYGGTTHTALALSLNLSQPYVGKLLKITEIKGTYNGGEKGDKDMPILEHWRSFPGNVGVNELYTKVAVLDSPEKQTEAYAILARGKPDGRDPKVKLENAKKAAARWGKILGTLVYESALDVTDEDSFFDAHLDKFMSIDKETKAHDRHAIIHSASRAFAKAAAGEKDEKDEKAGKADKADKAASKAPKKAGKAANASN